MHGLTEKDKAEICRIVAENKREAAAKSRYKIGDRVRTWGSSGIQLNKNGVWEDIPYDPKDPKNQSITRVTGWDSFGRIKVATQYGNNPHCSDWCHTESQMEPFTEGEDWVLKSPIKPGMKRFFLYDHDGSNFSKRGDEYQLCVEAAHILPGDWQVYYKPHEFWITRVVNESQMYEQPKTDTAMYL